MRKDLVAHFGSRTALHRTGVAHSWSDGKGARQEGPVRLDKWLLARSVLSTVDVYRQLEHAGTFADYLEVEYEEFARNNLHTYRRVLKFLGLDYHEPTWHHSKKLHASPETSIADYEALSRFANDLAEKQRAGTVSPRLKAWLGLYSRGRRLLPKSLRS